MSPRKEILKLARYMERALRRHDDDRGRTGWRGDHPEDLVDRIEDEVAELRQALRDGTTADVRKEAADVANFAMMVADAFEFQGKVTRRGERQHTFFTK